MTKYIRIYGLLSVLGVISITNAASAITCTAGAYLPANADACETCPNGYYCTGGDFQQSTADQGKTACTGLTYSDTAGATECTLCPKAVALKDRVTGYYFWSGDGVQKKESGCYAYIAEEDPFGDYTVSCAACNGDYGIGGCSQTQCMASKPQSCIAGYRWVGSGGTGGVWAAAAENLKPCMPVGAKYYSPDGALDATACPAGTTTIGYGPGADEAADCGVALHIGDATVHLRSEKRTSPALHVRVGTQIFYGDMATAVKGKIRIKIGATVYSVYDDSM